MTGKIITVKSPFGTFTCTDGDFITKELELYGAHNRNELSMVLSFIEKKDTIPDFGAHIGTFSIPFAHQIGPEGHVHSFEALKRNYNFLTENIRINNLEERITSYFGVGTDQENKFESIVDEENTGPPISNSRLRRIPINQLPLSRTR